jgi:hypothetical protein
MAWWRKPSPAEALAEQIRVEEMRKQLAELRAANDKRDAAERAVEQARRSEEEKRWQKKWLKPMPRDPAWPIKRGTVDPIEIAVKYTLSVALEDGRLREQDRARERHERRQARKHGKRRERDDDLDLDDTLDLGRGR